MKVTVKATRHDDEVDVLRGVNFKSCCEVGQGSALEFRFTDNQKTVSSRTLVEYVVMFPGWLADSRRALKSLTIEAEE